MKSYWGHHIEWQIIFCWGDTFTWTSWFSEGADVKKTCRSFYINCWLKFNLRQKITLRNTSWSSFVEGSGSSYLTNCQTNLVIALYALSLLFCKFINTTAYHLGRSEPSPPSNKELHEYILAFAGNENWNEIENLLKACNFFPGKLQCHSKKFMQQPKSEKQELKAFRQLYCLIKFWLLWKEINSALAVVNMALLVQFGFLF